MNRMSSARANIVLARYFGSIIFHNMFIKFCYRSDHCQDRHSGNLGHGDSGPAMVPQLLLLAIAPVIFGMLRTMVLVISKMSLAPVLLAVACHLPVFGIGRQFFPVILAAAPALAFRFTANGLLRPVNGRLK